MKLNFYHKRSNSSPTFNEHFFYYPKKEKPINFPRDLPSSTEAIWAIDYTKPLEAEWVVEVLIQAYFNGQTIGSDMYYDTYFYDPVHGYCKCNEIVNLYKKHIYKPGICACMKEIIFCGKTFLTVCEIEYRKAHKKWSPFKKGFQRVLYVEPLIIFDLQMYIVCSVNVMDVKLVEENTYEIGVSYDFVCNYYTYTNINISNYPTVESRLLYLKKLASERYAEDKSTYKEKCIELIQEWESTGALPKNKYYVHIYNLEYYSKWCEDRMYISRSEYEEVKSMNREEKVSVRGKVKGKRKKG